MSDPTVNRALVYILGDADARPVGCGALVEGRFVATCRHVWEDARRASADGDTVIVQYPYADAANGASSHPAVLADDCRADENPALDLVLLIGEPAPADVPMLPLPARPGVEHGDAYAHAYFARLDDTRDFPGRISPSVTAKGHRNFSGETEAQYWPEPGSSGGPTFLTQDARFAGLIRIAELGANQGRNPLREAVLVPASTVRRHVTRVVFDRAAATLGADPARLANVRRHVCALDIPVAGIPAVVAEMFADMRRPEADAAPEPVPPGDNSAPSVTAAIQASRDKLAALQPDAALGILDANIADRRQAYAAGVVPLLTERARVQTLTYDRAGARTTLGEIAHLLPDDAWCRVEIGDLWSTDGAVERAGAAFRDALAVALRGDDQSRVALCHDRIGDVQQAQGDLAAALTSYQASLAIAERLAKADPGNAGWQRDLSVSHNNIGDVQQAQGDLAAALTSYQASLAIAERLAKADPGNAGWQRDLSVSQDNIGDVQQAQGDLAAALASYQASLAIRERLAKADPGNAGWQRDLSVSHNKIGDVQQAQGDLAAALTSYQASLAIRERLAQADPGNAGWQRDLSTAQEKIGDVQQAQGDLAAALTSYQASLAIRERLAQADPGNAGWQVDVLWSNWRLANQGDDPARRWALIVAGLRTLAAAGKLSHAQAQWLPIAEANLAKLAGAGLRSSQE